MTSRTLLRHAALSLLLAGALAPGARAEILEKVVARVNGGIVTLSELESRQLAALQAAKVPSDQVEAWLRDNNARILQEAVDDLLISERGEELGIKPRPEYVQEIIDGIKKDNNIDSDAKFQEALRREGMSIGDLHRNIERTLVRRQVLARELESKTAVSEAEVRAEYDANLAEYRQPEKVRLQEIVVAPGAGALASAQKLVERARAGEDFGALARAESVGTTAANGGELGWLARGELSPALDQAAFALPALGVSAPISTPQGYRILRAEEKAAPKVVPFEQVSAELQQKVAQKKSESKYTEYLDGLRKNAQIQVMANEVPLQAPTNVPTGLALPGSAAPGQQPPAAPLPGSDDEISITGSASAERVQPDAAPTPAPTPVPTPVPLPAGEKPKPPQP